MPIIASSDLPSRTPSSNQPSFLPSTSLPSNLPSSDQPSCEPTISEPSSSPLLTATIPYDCDEYECELGRGETTFMISQHPENWFEGCKTRCSMTVGCIIFDYTNIAVDNACRLFSNETRRNNAGPLNREICECKSKHYLSQIQIAEIPLLVLKKEWSQRSMVQIRPLGIILHGIAKPIEMGAYLSVIKRTELFCRTIKWLKTKIWIFLRKVWQLLRPQNVSKLFWIEKMKRIFHYFCLNYVLLTTLVAQTWYNTRKALLFLETVREIKILKIMWKCVEIIVWWIFQRKYWLWL